MADLNVTQAVAVAATPKASEGAPVASCAITITRRAIDCYRQRVADLPEREICEQLASRMVERAATFGAPFVKLPGKQRLVLRGFTVVTVLPRDHAPAALDRRRTH